jgi:hypothetical protein
MTTPFKDCIDSEDKENQGDSNQYITPAAKDNEMVLGLEEETAIPAKDSSNSKKPPVLGKDYYSDPKLSPSDIYASFIKKGNNMGLFANTVLKWMGGERMIPTTKNEKVLLGKSIPQKTSQVQSLIDFLIYT